MRPASGTFGRRDRVLLRRDFQRILRQGRRRRGPHLGVAVVVEAKLCRIGLAIGRGCGHAPQRARMRRLLREAFRALRERWPPLELVVSCSVPWPAAGLDAVGAELEALVEQALTPRGRGR